MMFSPLKRRYALSATRGPFAFRRLRVLGLASWVRAVFAYYEAHHLEIVLGPWRLQTKAGEAVGYLEELRVAHGRIHVRGWSLLEPVHLKIGGHASEIVPSVERHDVSDALGCDAFRGFLTSLPESEGPLEVSIEAPSEVIRLDVAMPGPSEVQRARYRLRLRLVGTLLRLAPLILWGLANRDPALRQRVKHRLGLTLQPNTGLLRPQALQNRDVERRHSDPAPMPGMTIVLPVFNAFELLGEAIDRLERHTDVPWRLILVEDCSTDARVRPFLRERAEALRDAGHDVTLVEAEENRGFVGSVNAGLAAAQAFTDPVVVLNSDAFVPAGWASRLLRPLQETDVASVTPMTNDGEIFGIPAICTPTPLAPGMVDRIDAVARRHIAADAGLVDAPTGVGFCIALSPRFLKANPAFDPAFGRGYGEEVDWCRRASKQGGRHVAAADLFVEHRGGQSFGSREKRDSLRENGALITRRYPGYDALVQEFIQRDPLLTPRLTLACAMLAALPDQPEIPVIIAHSLGGGAENWLQHKIESTVPKAAIVLRLGGAHRVQIEVHTEAGCTSGRTDDLGLAEELVTLLPRRRIVYSCAVGDPRPLQIPRWLRALSGDAPLEVLFHDYLPISPSYTLLDSDGIYRDPPGPDRADIAHVVRRPRGKPIALQTWQKEWHRTLKSADRIVNFSDSSRDIVGAVYPDIRDRIVVEPHKLIFTPPTIARPVKTSSAIGVLGNIGPQKGAAVLQALSRALQGSGSRLVVFGRIAPGYTLAAPSLVLGGYQIGDLPQLARRYDIGSWFIPSVWPETFSYSTHESIETGLPVMGFDLGAQGAALHKAPNGHVIPFVAGQCEPDQLAHAALLVARQLNAAEPHPGPIRRGAASNEKAKGVAI